MKTLCLTACICTTALLTALTVNGQDREQDKGDRREGARHGDRPAMREGGEKGFMREKLAGMMTGEGGMQEAVLARILNNQQAASEIGLTEEQIKTLKTSLEEMKKQNEDLQKQMKESGLEQAKLMTSDTVDETALFSAVEKAGKIRTEMAKSRMKHMLLVKKTLKPDQVNKIKEMVQNRMKQMRSGEGESQGLRGKGEGEGARDRVRERMKKHQPEERKEEKSSGERSTGNV